MSKKRIFKLILLAFAIIAILYMLSYENIQKSKEKNTLLDKVNMISLLDIESVMVVCSERKSILAKSEILIVQNFLKEAEFKTTGGHNTPKYEYMLIFTMKDKRTLKLWGKVYQRYDWNKNDLYIEDKASPHFWASPLRIKNMGKWLIENIECS